MAKNNTFNNSKPIDYKDVEMLKKFLDPHSRIISRQKTGATALQQRKITEAIKRARFMGLLPFTSQ